LVGVRTSSDIVGDGCQVGETILDCEERTLCDRCSEVVSSGGSEVCEPAEVDCKTNETSLAGFCGRFAEFFPGATADCPSLADARALFATQCSELEVFALSLTTRCGYQTLHLQHPDNRYALLTYGPTGALVHAHVFARHIFGPCPFSTERGYSAGALDVSPCDENERCYDCRAPGFEGSAEIPDCE
jgi:hypothetical protein